MASCSKLELELETLLVKNVKEDDRWEISPDFDIDYISFHDKSNSDEKCALLFSSTLSFNSRVFFIIVISVSFIFAFHIY